MKHLVLTLLLAGAVSVSVAQRSTMGLRAGLNLARYRASGIGSGQISSRAGGLLGVTVTTALNKPATWAAQVEFLYSGKGATFTKAGSNQLSGTQRLHCADLLALAQFRAQGFELEAGPQVGLMMEQQAELKDPKGVPYVIPVDAFQLGYVLGAGYRGAGGLGFGVRYNGGLNQLSSYNRLYNSVVQLQLSYQFQPQLLRNEFVN